MVSLGLKDCNGSPVACLWQSVKCHTPPVLDPRVRRVAAVQPKLPGRSIILLGCILSSDSQKRSVRHGSRSVNRHVNDILTPR